MPHTGFYLECPFKVCQQSYTISLAVFPLSFFFLLISTVFYSWFLQNKNL